MPEQIPKIIAERIAWVKQAEQKSSVGFTCCVLALAAALMVAHYTIDELGYHPERNLWTAGPFWTGAWMYAAAPFVNWFLWKLEPARKLKLLKPIFMMSVVLCAGSAIAFSTPGMLHSIEAMHLHTFNPSIEKWHWIAFRYYWEYCTPLVLVVGNLILLWRWRKMTAKTASQPTALKPSATNRSRLILKVVAIITATVPCGMVVIYLVLPILPANRDVVILVRMFLVEPDLRNDFDYLIQSSFSAGQPLAPLLTHLELADLQRSQFYPYLDDGTFQAYILSPEIDSLPLDETNWRRTLWENFYPQIRHETDPVEAARIVVRGLRERVGIDPGYDYRVGIETIWTEQMTDEAGFERIYVAALRSVGIASYLDDHGQVELLEDNQWQPAPQALVFSFEEKKFPVPRNGLVNYRNWAAGTDWQK